jgi:3-methyl-2-oxobutanoate hydroxymethyltransferase
MIPASAFHQFKQKPLVVVTAYDAPFAHRAELAGVDVILVGDSLANAVLGYESTRDIGMDAMLLFVGAVARGARNTHIIADMPYGSDLDVDQAVMHAHQFLAAGAHSVKVEGAKLEVAKAFREAGIPLVGHLGLLPQTATSFKQVGRDPAEQKLLLEQALALEAEGVFAVVLEHIPATLGTTLTQRLAIPTIGIGAGPDTDGQVLVLHDLLGLSSRALPPFAKAFAEVGKAVEAGIANYAQAVRSKTFPAT